MKKSGSRLFLALAVFSGVLTADVFADRIYLKDGKVYEGKLIGQNDQRYLFSVLLGEEYIRMSFFPEDIERLERDKETVQTTLPYLKDVESFKISFNEDQPKVYEATLYKESQEKAGDSSFLEGELQGALSEKESEYYRKFNHVLKKHIDHFSYIQNLYINLTTATREDYAQAKQYLDQIYFELNNMKAPEIFQRTHGLYLESVKAGFMVFSALERGLLEEASRQIKISEETKQQSMLEFRNIIMERGEKTSGPASQPSAQKPSFIP